jgi:hypothetical protein
MTIFGCVDCCLCCGCSRFSIGLLINVDDSERWSSSFPIGLTPIEYSMPVFYKIDVFVPTAGTTTLLGLSPFDVPTVVPTSGPMEWAGTERIILDSIQWSTLSIFLWLTLL